MATPLKATSRYLNKYEAAYDRYSTTSPFFNETDWRKLTFGSNSEDLDMYIHALSKSKDIDKIKFDQDYMTKGEDDETRILALYNEVFGDRETLRDVEEYVYDESGNIVLDKNGNPKTTTVRMSNYDYTKKTIYETNKRNYEATLQEFEKESKGNLVADGAALVGEFLAGADAALTSIAEFAVTAADISFDILNALFGADVYNYRTNKLSKGYSEGWNAVADNWNYFWTDTSKGTFLQIPTELENGKASKTLRDAMTEFEIDYTHFRDEDGNLTTAGRYFVGAATTAGEMMASVLVGGSLGNIGQLSSKVSSIVNSTVYYAPMAARSLGETYQQFVDQGVSVSSASLICNQFIKTAVEVGIEFALGKIFGPTGLDKWLFGRDGAKSFNAKNFAQILGVHALDALQEGTEEVLQELSGIGIDNLFGAVVNESFGEISELTWQTIGDAFVISALVSAGHAAVSTTLGVASTPATMTLNEDGTTSYSGKIANYVKGYNMASFSEFYNESQKKISDALNRQGQLLPSESRLSELQRQRENLVRQINSVQNNDAQNNTSQTVINSAVSRILSEQGITDFNNADIKKFELQSLTKKVQDLDIEIAQTRASLTSESNANENVNKEIEALRSQYVEGFRGMYAAARMLQSFTSQLSEERFNAANDLLTKATEYLKSGKAEAPVLEQMYDEFIQTIQLSGVEVTVPLREAIERSKITKFIKKFTKKDVDSRDTVEAPDANGEMSREDYKRHRAEAIEILKGSKTIDTVVVARDGERVAADDKTLIVPEKLLKLGNIVVFNDLAEQTLVQNVLNGKYKGAVIEDILIAYKEISGNSEANEVDAIYHLLFDSSFFMTMLSGNQHLKTGRIKLADTDMFQFLSSLYETYDSYVPTDLQTTVYKNKVDSIRKSMGNALVAYLKMQPYADYHLDFLSESQKSAIKQHTEAMSVANRLVLGQGNRNDLAFIKRKINALAMNEDRKAMLLKLVTSTNRTDVQKALSTIDEEYRISFYGSYDGNIYLPLNSVKNRVFNHFLYANNTTIRKIGSMAPSNTAEELVTLISNQLSTTTDSRYELQIVSDDLYDPASGIFNIGQVTVAIVDKKSPLGDGLFVHVPNVKSKDKTIITRTGKQTALMKQILKPVNYGYYTIDDAITDSSILTDEVLAKIKKAYTVVNPETTYLFLKDYFTKDGLTLSVYADGQVGFVDVTKVQDFMVNKVAKTKVTNGASVSQFVKNPDAIPFLNNCRIELTSGDSHFEVTTDRGIVEGIIYINRDVRNDPEALKINLAHEIQHAIQYSNKLNTGNDGAILEKLGVDDQKKLMAELKNKLPGVFGHLKKSELVDTIDSFLYYGSGEVDAFGATTAEIAKFYPTLIQDNADGTATITLPWGSTYKTELTAKSKSSMTDRIKSELYRRDVPVKDTMFITFDEDGNEIVGDLRSLKTEIGDDYVIWTTPTGDFVNGAVTSSERILKLIKGNMSLGVKTFEDIKQLFYDVVLNEDVKLLGNKVFERFEEIARNLHYGNEINFYMMPDLNSNTAGLYVPKDTAIYYNWDALITYATNGDFDRIANIILHECIHAVTVNVINTVFAKIDVKSELSFYKTGIITPEIEKLTDAERAALSLAFMVRQLQSNLTPRPMIGKSTQIELYGNTDTFEFVAELSNPDFRNELKKQNLWTRFIELIRRILGITESNILKSAERALDIILSQDYSDFAVINNERVPHRVQMFKKTDSDKSTRGSIKIDHSTHAKSKGRTPRKRVPKKASKGTLLEPFAARQLSLPLQDFIVKSGDEKYQGIRSDIKNKIKNGTLTNHDLMEFLYNATSGDKTDELTFKLLNETIFKNEHFESLEDLDHTILRKTGFYYAIREYLYDLHLIEELKSTTRTDIYQIYEEKFLTDKSLKKYLDLSSSYWSGYEISEKNLRRLWLQHFDGSVYSGGYVAGVAKAIGMLAATKGWNITAKGDISTGGASLDATVGGSRDSRARTVGETIASGEDKRAFERFIVNIEDVELLVSVAEKKFVQDLRTRIESGENVDYETSLKELEDLKQKIKWAAQYSTSDFLEMYKDYIGDNKYDAYVAAAESIVAEVMFGESEEYLEELSDIDFGDMKFVRKKSDIMNNVRSRLRYISNHLSPAQIKLFVKENADLFNDDLSLREEVYRDTEKLKKPSKPGVTGKGVVRLKDESILLELEKRIKKLADDVKRGFYTNKKALEYREEMERKIRLLVKKLNNAESKSAKATTFTILSDEIHVDTDAELPSVVKRLLETELTKTARSTTQIFTNETDRHMLMNYKTFLDTHAETLAHLTQAEVNEIVDFYMNSQILPDTNHAKLYTTVQQLLLGYIYKMSTRQSSNFILTNEQASKIEQRFEFMVSTAATIVSTWKNVLKEIKPEEIFTKAMLKSSGIELSASDEADLISAIESGDIKRIKAAKEVAYTNLLKRYKNRKRTVFERLLRFERMAMLSGPGTMIRNWTSNTMVTIGNNLSELLVSRFPRSSKARKSEQYKVIGTKIDGKYSKWIKDVVIDGGLLSLISDGLVKYDTRKTDKMSFENHLAKLIADKLGSDLFNNQDWFTKIVTKMMSDERWVNKSFVKYLGKIMTEEQIDISKGLSDTKILELIAEAYTMAAQDYVHTSNFFNKMEKNFKMYLHNHFNPTTADGIFFMYKQIVPFASASWNWFMEGLNYTPIGLAKGIIQFCRLEKTVEAMDNARQKGERVRSSRFAEYLARRNIGKGTIGSIGFVAGILLAIFGKVELDDDDDEYKLKFEGDDGPTYIDLSDIFGTSGLLTGMTVAQAFRETDGFNFEKLTKVFTATLNTLFIDSTVGDLYNSFRYSYTDNFGEYLSQLPVDTLGMFVPNFVKTLSNIVKKYNVSYSQGALGQIERFVSQSIPFIDRAMPYKINPYTGDAELVNDAWFVLNVVNRLTPVKVKNSDFGDIELEAVSLGVKKGQLTGRYDIDGSKLSLSTRDVEVLNSYYGKLNAADLDDFMNDKTKYTVEDSKGKRVELKYSKMNDEQKKAVIERIMLNNSQIAKIYILTSKYGYKYYASDSEYARLKKLGINNVYRKTNKVEGFVKKN